MTAAMTKPKYKSDADEAIHSSAQAIFSIGVFDKETMREFDEACLIAPIETPTRPRYSLADLMVEMPQGLPRVEGWDEMPSVGSEMNPDRGTAARLSAERQDLPSDAAETLLRLLEIHHMAADIFVTEEDASAWLRAPHPMLDNERPLEAAKTSAGAQAVKNLLMSAKYGGVG